MLKSTVPVVIFCPIVSVPYPTSSQPIALFTVFYLWHHVLGKTFLGTTENRTLS